MILERRIDLSYPSLLLCSYLFFNSLKTFPYSASKNKRRVYNPALLVTQHGHESGSSHHLIGPALVGCCRGRFWLPRESTIVCTIPASSLPPALPSNYWLQVAIRDKETHGIDDRLNTHWRQMKLTSSLASFALLRTKPCPLAFGRFWSCNLRCGRKWLEATNTIAASTQISWRWQEHGKKTLTQDRMGCGRLPLGLFCWWIFGVFSSLHVPGGIQNTYKRHEWLLWRDITHLSNIQLMLTNIFSHIELMQTLKTQISGSFPLRDLAGYG